MRKTCSIIKKSGGGGRTRSLAYTLAEIVVVMLIIAVVAGVCIKITKTKLDNITAYTYYTGYSTLRNVSSQILGNFKTTDENYMQTAFFRKLNPIARLFLTPVFANEDGMKHQYYCAYECYVPVGSNYQNYNSIENIINCFDSHSVNTPDGWISGNDGTYPTSWVGDLADSPEELNCNQPVRRWYSWEVPGYRSAWKRYSETPDLNYTDKTVQYWDYESMRYSYTNDNYSQTYVPRGSRYMTAGYPRRFDCNDKHGGGGYSYGDRLMVNSNEDTLKSWPICIHRTLDDTPTENVCANQPSEATIHTEYCQNQREWEGYPSCTYKPVPCDQNGYRWSTDSCACVPETATLPRKGQNFCQKFVDYTNTKSNSEECNGDAIASTLTDFSNKKADIILRNGLKLYNVRQNPAPLALLAGNAQGGSYNLADGTTVNVNEYGYTVYLDIDGEKGSSTLWEDVFPFYITMGGKVVPLYHTEGDVEYGATSRQYLMISVQKETISDGKRVVFWIKKSVPFKEGACSSGYLNPATPYCKNGKAVPLDANCSDNPDSCFLKHISPVKFF